MAGAYATQRLLGLLPAFFQTPLPFRLASVTLPLLASKQKHCAAVAMMDLQPQKYIMGCAAQLHLVRHCRQLSLQNFAWWAMIRALLFISPVSASAMPLKLTPFIYTNHHSFLLSRLTDQSNFRPLLALQFPWVMSLAASSKTEHYLVWDACAAL